MLKLLITTGLSLILAEAAIGQTQLNPVDLVCYMQTADGRTVDLVRLCGQSRPPIRSAVNSAQSGLTPETTVPVKPGVTPYSNLGGLDIYSRGRSAPCFGLDDQGNPCSASR